MIKLNIYTKLKGQSKVKGEIEVKNDSIILLCWAQSGQINLNINVVSQ